MDRGGLFGVLGRRRFLEFYRTAHGLDLARFRDAFEDFFGRDIEEAWELAARVEPYRVAACPCALGEARAGEDVSHDGASRPTSVAAELSGETWLGPLTRLAQTLVSNPFSLELAAAEDFVEDDSEDE